MTPSKLTPMLLLALPVLFFVAFFVAPLCTVFLSSITDGKGDFTFAHYAHILFDGYHWDILVVTLKLSLLTTLFCILLGYPLAYFLVNVVGNGKLRRICVVLLVLPLFTSNIVRSFGWIVLLGRRGLINDGLTGLGIIDFPMRFLGTETGILIGLIYINLPFVVIAVANTLAKIDRSYSQAASDLGAGKWAIFRTITFPLSVPGMIAGALIVFSLSVSAYVTPALLGGGRITMFSMLIFQQYSSVLDFHFGGALSITLLVFTLLIVSVANFVGKARS